MTLTIKETYMASVITDITYDNIKKTCKAISITINKALEMQTILSTAKAFRQKIDNFLKL